MLKVVEYFQINLFESKVKDILQENTIQNNLLRNVGSEDLPDISEDEVIQALRQMKSNKAPEEDQVTADMIIEGSNKLIKIIAISLNECLQQGKLPETRTTLKQYYYIRKVTDENQGTIVL